VNREWVDATQFAGFELIDIPAEEPGASNALLIDDTVIVPSAFPRTIAMLEARGFKVRPIDVSELQKAEGGVTCKSIIFNGDDSSSQQP
jgi:dimethylargininase